MILTATEVTVLTNISASAISILNSGLIPIVQERITLLTNNYFVNEELSVQTTARFNATARSITIDQTSWAEFGFQALDTIFIYGSYRNDQYCEIASITDNVAILASAYSVVDEMFNDSLGKVISFFVVKWPQPIKYAAAQMVAYDYDVRPSVKQNIISRSLGPLSESYTNSTDEYGYPKSITEMLVPYRLAKLM